jgi:hypothetical protein
MDANKIKKNNQVVLSLSFVIAVNVNVYPVFHVRLILHGRRRRPVLTSLIIKIID